MVKNAFVALLLCLFMGIAWADAGTDAGAGAGAGAGDASSLPPGVVPTPDSQTFGNVPNSQNQYNQMMEQCKVVDKDGNGLIKPYMADSGVNLTGDASAWIWVPYGQCAKINAGDFKGISQKILSKIDTSNIQQAPTLGQ